MMKNTKAELDDKDLDKTSGGGEYISFVDSDDYESKKTYEYAYKSEIKEGFTERENSPLN